jgi:hypothetical protein
MMDNSGQGDFLGVVRRIRGFLGIFRAGKMIEKASVQYV